MTDMVLRKPSLLTSVTLVIGLLLPACRSGTKTPPGDEAASIPVMVATVACGRRD